MPKKYAPGQHPTFVEALNKAHEGIMEYRQAQRARLPELRAQLATERDVRQREWLQVQIETIESAEANEEDE